jgi:cytoskeletal protein CcmA (bactofilin family)
MFIEKDKNIDKISTLIGEECIINGNLNGTGVIKVDGSLNGDIIWKDDVIVGSNSTCIGNISCKNAYIIGKLEGNLICEDMLTIEAGGIIKGDITVKKVVIKEGGSLDGKCTMVVEGKADELIK